MTTNECLRQVEVIITLPYTDGAQGHLSEVGRLIEGGNDCGAIVATHHKGGHISYWSGPAATTPVPGRLAVPVNHVMTWIDPSTPSALADEVRRLRKQLGVMPRECSRCGLPLVLLDEEDGNFSFVCPGVCDVAAGANGDPDLLPSKSPSAPGELLPHVPPPPPPPPSPATPDPYELGYMTAFAEITELVEQLLDKTWPLNVRPDPRHCPEREQTAPPKRRRPPT